MKKILFGLALLFATPVQAQTVQLSYSRFEALVNAAPSVCQTAYSQKSVPMSEALMALVPLYTPSEKLIMLSMCKTYLIGRMDQLTGR
jgi:hypothetical protein